MKMRPLLVRTYLDNGGTGDARVVLVIARSSDVASGESHVGQGRAWVKRWMPKLMPGHPQPGRLDMRWSGQMIGVSWRYAAFKQLGMKYIDAAWENVKMTPEFWRLTKEFDSSGWA